MPNTPEAEGPEEEPTREQVIPKRGAHMSLPEVRALFDESHEELPQRIKLVAERLEELYREPILKKELIDDLEAFKGELERKLKDQRRLYTSIVESNIGEGRREVPKGEEDGEDESEDK